MTKPGRAIKTILGGFLACGLWATAAANSLAEDEPAAADKPGVAGIWQGSLDVGGAKLRLVLNIAKQEDGSLKATLDSPDQGAKGIPIDSVTLEEGAVTAKLKALGASYEGKLSDDGKSIEGKWTQGGASFALTVERVEKAAEALPKPQEPKKPYPYAEEEVSYENESAGVKLAGTLTLPKSDKPVPAVLLITGSGAQDRDESLMGHKPFLVLADALTRRGIAVLRVDDRGVGGSTGNLQDSTTDDLAGDALAGVAYLKTRKEIVPTQIGLAGHSEGGLIAPLAATRSPDVAFIVLIAGSAVPGEEILYLQGELIGRAAGATDDKLAALKAQQKQIFDVLRAKLDPAEADAKLQAVVDEQIAALGDIGEEALKAAKAQAAAQIKGVKSAWFQFFLTYDPRPTLAKVTCPVLAINGEKDLQVDPDQNLPEIEAALKAAGHKDYTIKELPGLNHLLQTCTTGAVSEYGQIEETMAPAALELIGDWIVAHTSSKPASTAKPVKPAKPAKPTKPSKTTKKPVKS